MAGDLAAVLRAARSSLGYLETPVNHNKFSRYWGAPPEPWCADAACYWLAMGHALDVPHSPSTQVLHQYYLNDGRAGFFPRIGSLVFFGWTGWEIDHVELIEAIRKDGRLITIGGNTVAPGLQGSQRAGGGVWRRNRGLAKVRGYGHPAYGTATARPLLSPPLMLTAPHMRGQAVSNVQRALRKTGSPIAVDGDFGPATATAVRRFQRNHQLAVDGVVGPETLAALRKAIGH